jgi:hypothetical protein
MSTRLATVAVVALVVLSGCAGSAAQSTTATETSANATEQADASSADLPPGVSADGVENASALLAAHRAALAETGYVYRVQYAVSAEGSFAQQGAARSAVAKNHAPIRVRSVSDIQSGNQSRRVRTDVWANETVALYEYRSRNRTRYDKSNASLSPDETERFARRATLDVVAEASLSNLVELALRSGEYEVAGTESVDGATLTTLRATAPNGSVPGLANASTYDGTLVVDDRGRVHEMSLIAEGDRSSVRYEFTLAKFGGVVVEYPAWADQALATVNAEIDVGSRDDYFAISNEGGETLPPASTVRVGHDGTNVTLELDRSLAPGDEAYVYFPADGGDPVLASEPPAGGEAEPLDGEYRFSVAGPTGDALINATLGFDSASETETPTE